jgi:hypothetical protein
MADKVPGFDDHPRKKSWIETHEKIMCLCEVNREHRRSIEASLSQSRPYQRLLLAALHHLTQAPLSHDLVLLILEHLAQSPDCPYKANVRSVRAIPKSRLISRSIGSVNYLTASSRQRFQSLEDTVVHWSAWDRVNERGVFAWHAPIAMWGGRRGHATRGSGASGITSAAGGTSKGGRAAGGGVPQPSKRRKLGGDSG